MQKIFITTGGTGGHIIPARCLAQKLTQENIQVFVLADAKYRSYIKPSEGFRSVIISSSQMTKSPIALLKAAVKIGLGALQATYYFLRYRPKYVVSFGGYATFPILVAAIITRTKIILHEQNAHLGKVNRIFANYADKIALTFKETSGIKYATKTVVTGNPVRQEIAALNAIDYAMPKKYEPIKRDKMGYDVILASEIDDYLNAKEDETFNILVLGGSGGAKIFSDILPKAFFNLDDSIKNILHISQQCRKDLVADTFAQYKKFNISISIGSFFEDMTSEIKAAHLVIARAGSSSIVEFCAAKKPMILIPFAAAADDHQMKNARILEKQGAAIVLNEKEFTINKINEIVKNLVNNKSILHEMSRKAAQMANLHAVDNLANLVK